MTAESLRLVYEFSKAGLPWNQTVRRPFLCLVVLTCLAPALAAESQTDRGTLTTRMRVSLDEDSQEAIWVSTNRAEDYEQLAGRIVRQNLAEGPPGIGVARPAFIVRASLLARQLRERFAERVTLAEIDVASDPDSVGYGLAVAADPAEDLAGLREFQKMLREKEVVTAIQSGDRVKPGAINDTQLRQLADVFPHVRRLRLFCCQVSGQAWESIARWPDLVELHISGANLGTRPAEALAGLSRLTQLDLTQSSLRDDDFTFVGQLTKLESLTCRITDSSAAHLAGLTELKKLDLSGSPIGDGGTRHIAACTNLVYLDLANTGITDATLPNLSQMSHLHFLNLDGTRVTGAELASLRELPLSQLQMQGTLLTGEAWMRHVPKFESYDKGLMMITRGTKITREEAEKIREILPQESQAFLHDR